MDGADAGGRRHHTHRRVAMDRAIGAIMLRRGRVIIVGLSVRIARLRMADRKSCGTAHGQERRQAAGAEPDGS